MTRTGARLAAFGALFATSGALAAVILRADPDSAKAGRANAAGVGQLADESTALRAELERLRVGRSARPAQRAVRAAMDAAEALRDSAGATADERTLNAIEREIEYLDAVGSLLSNPRSTLAPELPERGRRAQAALAAAPGGEAAAAATSGWDDLLEFARRRRAAQ